MMLSFVRREGTFSDVFESQVFPLLSVLDFLVLVVTIETTPAALGTTISPFIVLVSVIGVLVDPTLVGESKCF